MPQTKIIASCATIVVIGLGVWLWLRAGVEATENPPTSIGTLEAAQDSSTEVLPENDSASNASLDSGPLPAPGTPLVQMFDELRRRAEAGSPQAACRLSVELKHCTSLENEKKELRAAVMYAPPNQVMSAEQLQRQQERQASIAQLEENCGELTKTAGLDYPAWLLRAAKAGHLNSQLNYVRDESYLARAAVERPELVRQFVQNAAKFMTESVALGISDNLEPLAVALAESDAEPMPSANWLSMTVDYDPVLARTYMHTYARELKARFASVPLSTDPKTRALELELINQWTFAGEHRARLDKYDQNLSADQIATSNAAVELLLRDRKRAAAELVSRMSAGDIHLLNGGSRNLSDPRNNSTTRLAEAARMCETNLVSRGND